MKRSILFILLAFTYSYTFAQKNITGTVIDSTKQTVIGALVKITSPLDTISTSTNIDGIFSFRNIKSSNFTISVNGLGYRSFSKSYQFDNSQNTIRLENITLKTQTNMLDMVVVDGTPTITYKTDTMEYRADAYNMKENATVEDLVKKMEGMEVDKDGTLTVQGEQIKKARINGKDYFGGDVEAALKDLPSDIVDKIQIIDDYGDEARRTGVKDGDPQRVLNIVTKSNKRVGNRGRFEVGAGSDNRYQLTANANRFNGNQQLGIRSSLNNTVTGIANTNGDLGGGNQGGNNRNNGGGNNRGQGGSGGNPGGNSGSAGTRQAGRFGLNYNDDLSSKLKLESSYNYNGSNTKSTSESLSDEIFKDKDAGIIEHLYTDRNGDSKNKSYTHALSAKLEYEIDSANWLIFSPTLNLKRNTSNSITNLKQSGIFRQDQVNQNANIGKMPNYGLTLNYGHRFNKKGTVSSVQLSANNSENTSDRDANNRRLYLSNDENESLLKDSLLHRAIANRNLTENYRGSLTFSHPLTSKSRLEFNGQVNYRGYDNSQITHVIDEFGYANTVDSLSKIFNYSFTESRLSLNYKYTQTKYNFALGLSGVPSALKGYSESRGNSTHRNSFNIIPIARFEYKWSRQKRFSINYTGNPTEPTFDQIQDVPDVSNPQNVIIGNPDLKAAFRHSIQANFNNYISQTKLNYYAGFNATFNENQVIRNVILKRDEYNGRKMETHFMNANKGNYNYRGNYGISKRFGDNKYNLSYNGTAGYGKTLSMNNNSENIGKTWNLNQRLNFQIDPNDWLEVNPNIRYSFNQGNFSLDTISNSRIHNWTLSLSSKVYFQKTFYLTYDLNKNFIEGINANVTSNPFIINASLTKEFLKKKAGAVSLKAYDLLNQNNFINRQITDNAIIDTKSNALSRYFILTFTWTPQKWTGGKKSSGNFQRRGDGSYMGG